VEFFQFPTWLQRGTAPCGDVVDPDTVFFPIRGGSSKAARAICAACHFRPECLKYAIDGNEVLGIWGGTSDRERRKLKQQKARFEKERASLLSNFFTLVPNTRLRMGDVIYVIQRYRTVLVNVLGRD
jgi:Transcription factor WhiB